MSGTIPNKFNGVGGGKRHKRASGFKLAPRSSSQRFQRRLSRRRPWPRPWPRRRESDPSRCRRLSCGVERGREGGKRRACEGTRKAVRDASRSRNFCRKTPENAPESLIEARAKPEKPENAGPEKKNLRRPRDGEQRLRHECPAALAPRDHPRAFSPGYDSISLHTERRRRAFLRTWLLRVVRAGFSEKGTRRRGV